MKESKIEQTCNRLARQCGFTNFKGNSRVGGADQIYIKGVYCFFVEFKTDKGRLREAQRMERDRVINDGGHYHECRNLEQFRQILIEELECLESITLANPKNNVSETS